MKRLLMTFAAGLMLAGFVRPVTADTITQTNPDITGTGSLIDSSGTYTFSTTNDLLLNAAATSSPALNDDQTNWERDHGGVGGVPVLTNGTYGGNPQRNTTATGGSSGGFSVTYDLGSGLLGGANPEGYAINDIEVYSGWGDAGRYAQAYTVSYELVGSSMFTELSEVSQYPNPVNALDSGAMTELAPSSGEFLPIVGAVQAIKFDFTNPPDPGGNFYTGYAELVVNGKVVPEPGTYALMGLGLAALLFFRKARSSRA